MVKTSANPNAKGKAAAASAAISSPKTTPRRVRPKAFKKKAKADAEKQKVAAAKAATTAEASPLKPAEIEKQKVAAAKAATTAEAFALAPALKPAEVTPVAAVAKANGGKRMRRREKMKGTEGDRIKGDEKGGIKEKEKKDDKAREKKGEAGFIFMCSAKTKPECFHNGVFGLPKGKIDVVEKIQPGAKLFLYDFDLKLLYGVYKAKTKGGLDLVRSAFHGKFPAQVKFRVDKDCLPLPESSFKHAIKENYNSKGKFTQELNPRQVHKLLELFKPVSVPQRSMQYAEERRRLDVSEGRRSHYVEERRLPRHTEEMCHLRPIEERRLPYDHEERRHPRYVEDIRHPRYLEETHAITDSMRDPHHFSELQHAPPTYYRHVAPNFDDRYHQPQVDVMYERSAPRAIVEATDREVLLARDYRVPEEIVARSNHVDELYRSYRLATREMDLHHDPSYVTTAYENPRPAYSEIIQMPVSTRANVPGVTVSSLYSFAGAPAYR
uniref:DCD domain-containing protein n=1 Tax=Leersia perrieri TaxID=77586 RepID=A0A0D9VKZ8_9ORYZ